MTRISSKRLKRRRRPNVPIILAILTAIVFLSGLTFLFTVRKLDWSKPKPATDFSGELDHRTKPKRVSPGHWKKESKEDDDHHILERTQEWKAKFGKMDTMELIKRGELNLVDIRIRSSSSSNDDTNNKPYNVAASFCHVDWKIHKDDPSSAPMYKYLIDKSRLCRNKETVDLYEAVQMARDYDLKQQPERTGDDDDKVPYVHAMEPKGFVFHESRCGSTLVANSLAAFDPDLTRVYSESGPPVEAAKAFNKDRRDSSVQLLRDVIYMMGRTNDPSEENLFFKIQSIGSKSIWAFREAFPTTPWMYVYREPVQVMMSHVAEAGTRRAVCLRTLNRPAQDLKQLVSRIDGKPFENNSLTSEEHCAAHLATLCEAAAKELKKSNGIGRAVNYEDLPNILIEDIIPKHFLPSRDADGKIDKSWDEVELSDEMIERIEQVAGKYSKGGDKRKVWTEEGDSKKKEDNARIEIRDASEKYLYPVYKELESLKEEATI